MNSEYHEPGSDEHLNPQPDYEAQQAARDAIMQIPLFPDLPVLLKNTLDYGPHVDMLQHFVYWFHPRKPKMQKRWTLWKTFPEWKEKCGLSERQVKKGRAKLGEMGIVGWKRGQYGRIHYRVDWVALASILGVGSNPDTMGVQIDEMDDDFFDLEDGFNLDGVGVQFNPDTKASSSIRTPRRPVQSGHRRRPTQYRRVRRRVLSGEFSLTESGGTRFRGTRRTRNEWKNK
jgi:hypothetical protein